MQQELPVYWLMILTQLYSGQKVNTNRIESKLSFYPSQNC